MSKDEPLLSNCPPETAEPSRNYARVPGYKKKIQEKDQKNFSLNLFYTLVFFDIWLMISWSVSFFLVDCPSEEVGLWLHHLTTKKHQVWWMCNCRKKRKRREKKRKMNGVEINTRAYVAARLLLRWDYLYAVTLKTKVFGDYNHARLEVSWITSTRGLLLRGYTGRVKIAFRKFCCKRKKTSRWLATQDYAKLVDIVGWFRLPRRVWDRAGKTRKELRVREIEREREREREREMNNYMPGPSVAKMCQ